MGCSYSKTKYQFSSRDELQVLGTPFLRAVDASFQEFISEHLNTQITGSADIYLKIFSFLKYLASGTSYSSTNIIDKLNLIGHQRMEYHDWVVAIEDYRDYIISALGKTINTNNFLSMLSSFLRFSASNGLWPHDLRIRGIKLPKKIAKSMLSVSSERHHNIQEQVEDVINKIGIDENREQVRTILSNVMQCKGKKISNLDDLINESCTFLNDNLKMIRINAEKKLRPIIANFLYSIRSVNKKDNIKAARNINKLLKRRKLLLKSAKDNQIELKKIKRTIVSYGEAGLSAYIFHYHNGITPRGAKEYRTPKGYNNSKLYCYLTTICRELEIGNLKNINNKFNLYAKAQILAQCILYIDTCNNETSIRYLDPDCLIEYDEEYHLKDNKNRADMSQRKFLKLNKDPNENRLDVLSFNNAEEHLKLSVPKIIKFLIQYTKNYRQVTTQRYKTSLFLTFYKNGVDTEEGYIPTPLSSTYSTTLFKMITKELTNGAVSIPPNLIRQSQMQLTALLTRDPFKVMRQARHKNCSSTNAYLKHLMLFVQSEQEIREFMDVMEALVTQNIDEFVDYVGIDKNDYMTSQAKAQKILKNQFGGLICKEPQDSPHAEKGTVCKRVDLCPTCTNRVKVLLATPNAILNTMLLNDALQVACEMRGKEDKWELWRAYCCYALNEYEQNTKSRNEYLAAVTLFEKKKYNNPYLKVFNL